MSIREFGKIVWGCILHAIVYGILHDVISVTIYEPYLGLHHPPLLGGTRNAILLAVGWGIIATWWVGGLLGVGLGIVAHWTEPFLTWDHLKKSVYLFTLCLGILNGFLVLCETVLCLYYTRTLVDYNRLVIVQGMHFRSYLFGGIGGILLMIDVALNRKSLVASS